MNKKCYLILIVFFFIAGSLFAQPFDMILVGDPIIEDIRFLSLESTRTFLSFTPPFSPAEIKNFLDGIDESKLSPAAMAAYNRINDRLTPKAPVSVSFRYFSFFLSANFTLEGKFKFSEDVPLNQQYDTNTQLVSVPFRFHFANVIQLYIEPFIAVNDRGYYNINIPLDYTELNISMPLRTFLAAGGNWWNFQIGRDKLNFGSANIENMVFGDEHSYYDFARLSLFAKYFKYSLTVTQMPLILDIKKWGNQSIFNRYEDDTIYPGLYKKIMDYDLQRSMNRYFYLHRFDVSIKNRFAISLMEGILVANSPLEIRYLNPMMIFHSLFAWEQYELWDPDGKADKRKWGSMIGSFMALEMNWNIFGSLGAYGQWIINQWALPQEIQTGKAQPPNAFGFLAGLQYSHSFKDWGSVFFAEFAFANPYMHINDSPFSSYIKMHHNTNKIQYFGFSQRDAIITSVGANFFNNGSLKFTGVFTWQVKGEKDKNGITWDWERYDEEGKNPSGAFKEKTPTGKDEHTLIASLGAEWKLLPFKKVPIELLLKTKVTGIFLLEHRDTGKSQTGGEAVFSVGLRY